MFWIKVLLRLRASRFVPKRLVYELFFLFGADIPPAVVMGDGVILEHRAMGVVLHPDTRIGNRVRIWHNVTLGRSDVYVPASESDFGGFVIEDDAYLCSGATILGGPGITRVGRGTIVAAGAVLRDSTGDWEVWAGVPAKRVGARRPEMPAPGPGRETVPTV
jgi:serine O-acetyltransferase